MRKIILLTIITLIALTVEIRTSGQDVTNTWAPLQGDGTLRRVQVPILMYHYISELPPEADAIRRGLTLHPDRFREHLTYLSENNYNTISLTDLDNALENGTLLPPNPVILTFDDGYEDAHRIVYPLLLEYDMVGTFFIATQFIDDNRSGYLTWEQINEMAANGMQMEGHSKTHPSLVERDFDYLVFEIVGSLESLEAHTGIESTIFSYPAGRYDDNTLTFMQSTHVERAVTTQTGTIHTTDNRFELQRMRVTDETGVAGLQYLLTFQQ